MLLEEAKKLLTENNIPFELQEFTNEKEYWHHTMLFPYTNNAKNCKVIAIIVKSNNSNKHIELQFNTVDNDFVFDDLRFGGFCYELFDVPEKQLKEELLSIITEIVKGNIGIIVINDLKKKKWLSDGCFDLSDEDDALGKQGFEEAIAHIKSPKGFLDIFFKSKRQYEIYDWNTYQCIIK